MEAKVAKTLMEAYASVYDRPEVETIEEGETSGWFGGIKKRFQGMADAYNKSRGVPSPQQIRQQIQQQRNRSPFDKTSGGSITVTQTRKPTLKTPYSKGEDGKLTDFGAGGGRAKMEKTGMSVAEIEQLGRKNLGKKSPGGPPGMRERMGEDVDVFDVVKGYLMTEHDLTEEQALKVMIELEDEQIDESIVPVIDNILKRRSEGPRKMGPNEGGRRPKKDRPYPGRKPIVK